MDPRVWKRLETVWKWLRKVDGEKLSMENNEERLDGVRKKVGQSTGHDSQSSIQISQSHIHNMGEIDRTERPNEMEQSRKCWTFADLNPRKSSALILTHPQRLTTEFDISSSEESSCSWGGGRDGAAMRAGGVGKSWFNTPVKLHFWFLHIGTSSSYTGLQRAHSVSRICCEMKKIKSENGWNLCAVGRDMRLCFHILPCMMCIYVCMVAASRSDGSNYPLSMIIANGLEDSSEGEHKFQ